MIAELQSIDFSRLENPRHLPNGDINSACPACREIGKDTRRDNLRIYPSGAYHCIAFQDDAEHRKHIFALIGIKGQRIHDPAKDHQWRQRRASEQREAHKQALRESARKHRAEIINNFPWHFADAWEDSPQRIDCDLVASDPRHFLFTLFPPDTTLWTGKVHESGKTEHATQWKTCADWTRAPHLIGPMTTPAIWQSGIFSRSAGNVIAAPYTVLDFDGFDGVSPKTPQETETHIAASLALIRWLREKFHWQLAAIIHTGNKSLHAWFHTPSLEVLDSLKITAPSLGIDAGLIGRPEHPCRLPGQLHEKTSKTSRVLWLQYHSVDPDLPGKSSNTTSIIVGTAELEAGPSDAP
ncbi:MAG: hypothetical protein HC845_15415 [Akkermansiaceae bacterium]|nr:hypothetical protein [Akkermansiaceae bacterium]